MRRDVDGLTGQRRNGLVFKSESQASKKSFTLFSLPRQHFKKVRFRRIDLLRFYNCIYNRVVVTDR